MTDLIDRIRAYVAAIPTHRCDGCALDFTSETMTCPSCGIADRTRWVADSEANRLLREVTALEPTMYTVQTIDAILADKRRPFAMTCATTRRDQFTMPLYTLTGATHD